MMVKKIIVDYPDDMTTDDALRYVLRVVEEGKISEAAGVAHFCWITSFKMVRQDLGEVIVATRRKKVNQTSDSPIIYRRKK